MMTVTLGKLSLTAQRLRFNAPGSRFKVHNATAEFIRPSPNSWLNYRYSKSLVRFEQTSFYAKRHVRSIEARLPGGANSSGNRYELAGRHAGGHHANVGWQLHGSRAGRPLPHRGAGRRCARLGRASRRRGVLNWRPTRG